MVDTTILLIGRKRAQDENGVWRVGEETSREVFARVDSVNRAEFFSAGQRGFRPEFRFTLFHVEYEGEGEVEYLGDRFAVYRTYRVPGTDDLELYAERKAGVHNGADPDNSN